MTLPKNLKTKKLTNKQVEQEHIKGSKAYRIREQEEKEAKEEIKKFKIPPCIGHDFEDTSGL